MTKELILTMLKQGVKNIDGTFAAVPDDKLNWKPLDNGRTALDLYGEAAQTCGMVERFAVTSGAELPSRELFQQFRLEREPWTRADAQSFMATKSAALFAAVENLSEEQLAVPIHSVMGGGMTLPMGGWIMMAYRTCLSRFAQINYIQTLYGDFDSH